MKDKHPPRTSVDLRGMNLWIIEDDDAFRKTLVNVLHHADGMHCEHAFSSCEDALALIKTEFAPEIILMDIVLPGINGIEGTQRFRSISPATQVIMITNYTEDEKIFRALCAGASGYLLKTSTGEEIVTAIREVRSGGAHMNSLIARRVIDMFSRIASTPATDYGLTDKENWILKMLTDGLSKREIAERMTRSLDTVETHIKNIYSKLHVHTQAGAVAKALRARLLP
jgi:DNA-binding NarL/FixJ family response regulator